MEVNLLGGVQLEAPVVLAVEVPAVVAAVPAVLKAIVHQAHQEVAVRAAAAVVVVVVEAVVTVIADQIVTLTQRKRMRRKSLVVQVRMMTKRRVDNSKLGPMRQFCKIKFIKQF